MEKRKRKRKEKEEAHDNRVFLVLVEIRWFDHVSVKLRSIFKGKQRDQ